MRMTPNIGATGKYVLSCPWETIPGITYTTTALATYPSMLERGIDVLANVYIPHGLDESKYLADLELNAMIVVLMAPNAPTIYVPDTYIVKYPDTSLIQYSHVVMSVSMGAVPDMVDLSFVENVISDTVRDLMGVEGTVRTHKAPTIGNITPRDHNLLELNRKNAISINTTNSSKVRALADTNLKLNERVQLLERIIMGGEFTAPPPLDSDPEPDPVLAWDPATSFYIPSQFNASFNPVLPPCTPEEEEEPLPSAAKIAVDTMRVLHLDGVDVISIDVSPMPNDRTTLIPETDRYISDGLPFGMHIVQDVYNLDTGDLTQGIEFSRLLSMPTGILATPVVKELGTGADISNPLRRYWLDIEGGLYEVAVGIDPSTLPKYHLGVDGTGIIQNFRIAEIPAIPNTLIVSGTTLAGAPIPYVIPLVSVPLGFITQIIPKLPRVDVTKAVDTTKLIIDASAYGVDTQVDASVTDGYMVWDLDLEQLVEVRHPLKSRYSDDPRFLDINEALDLEVPSLSVPLVFLTDDGRAFKTRTGAESAGEIYDDTDYITVDEYGYLHESIQPTLNFTNYTVYPYYSTELQPPLRTFRTFAVDELAIVDGHVVIENTFVTRPIIAVRIDFSGAYNLIEPVGLDANSLQLLDGTASELKTMAGVVATARTVNPSAGDPSTLLTTEGTWGCLDGKAGWWQADFPSVVELGKIQFAKGTGFGNWSTNVVQIYLTDSEGVVWTTEVSYPNGAFSTVAESMSEVIIGDHTWTEYTEVPFLIETLRIDLTAATMWWKGLTEADYISRGWEIPTVSIHSAALEIEGPAALNLEVTNGSINPAIPTASASSVYTVASGQPANDAAAALGVANSTQWTAEAGKTGWWQVDWDRFVDFRILRFNKLSWAINWKIDDLTLYVNNEAGQILRAIVPYPLGNETVAGDAPIEVIVADQTWEIVTEMPEIPAEPLVYPTEITAVRLDFSAAVIDTSGVGLEGDLFELQDGAGQPYPTTGMTASASSEWFPELNPGPISPFAADQLFVYNGSWATTSNTGGWLQVDLPSAMAVDRVSFTKALSFNGWGMDSYDVYLTDAAERTWKATIPWSSTENSDILYIDQHTWVEAVIPTVGVAPPENIKAIRLDFATATLGATNTISLSGNYFELRNEAREELKFTPGIIATASSSLTGYPGYVAPSLLTSSGEWSSDSGDAGWWQAEFETPLPLRDFVLNKGNSSDDWTTVSIDVYLTDETGAIWTSKIPYANGDKTIHESRLWCYFPNFEWVLYAEAPVVTGNVKSLRLDFSAAKNIVSALGLAADQFTLLDGDGGELKTTPGAIATASDRSNTPEALLGDVANSQWYTDNTHTGWWQVEFTDLVDLQEITLTKGNYAYAWEIDEILVWFTDAAGKIWTANVNYPNGDFIGWFPSGGGALQDIPLGTTLTFRMDEQVWTEYIEVVPVNEFPTSIASMKMDFTDQGTGTVIAINATDFSLLDADGGELKTTPGIIATDDHPETGGFPDGRTASEIDGDNEHAAVLLGTESKIWGSDLQHFSLWWQADFPTPVTLSNVQLALTTGNPNLWRFNMYLTDDIGQLWTTEIQYPNGDQPYGSNALDVVIADYNWTRVSTNVHPTAIKAVRFDLTDAYEINQAVGISDVIVKNLSQSFIPPGILPASATESGVFGAEYTAHFLFGLGFEFQMDKGWAAPIGEAGWVQLDIVPVAMATLGFRKSPEFYDWKIDDVKVFLTDQFNVIWTAAIPYPNGIETEAGERSRFEMEISDYNWSRVAREVPVATSESSDHYWAYETEQPGSIQWIPVDRSAEVPPIWDVSEYMWDLQFDPLWLVEKPNWNSPLPSAVVPKWDLVGMTAALTFKDPQTSIPNAITFDRAIPLGSGDTTAFVIFHPQYTTLPAAYVGQHANGIMIAPAQHLMEILIESTGDTYVPVSGGGNIELAVYNDYLPASYRAGDELKLWLKVNPVDGNAYGVAYTDPGTSEVVNLLSFTEYLANGLNVTDGANVGYTDRYYTVERDPIAVPVASTDNSGQYFAYGSSQPGAVQYTNAAGGALPTLFSDRPGGGTWTELWLLERRNWNDLDISVENKLLSEVIGDMSIIDTYELTSDGGATSIRFAIYDQDTTQLPETYIGKHDFGIVIPPEKYLLGLALLDHTRFPNGLVPQAPDYTVYLDDKTLWVYNYNSSYPNPYDAGIVNGVQNPADEYLLYLIVDPVDGNVLGKPYKDAGVTDTVHLVKYSEYIANGGSIKIPAVAPSGTHSEAVMSLNPVAYWRLGETTGIAVIDEMGVHDGQYNGSVSLGEASLVDGETDTAISLDGNGGFVNTLLAFDEAYMACSGWISMTQSVIDSSLQKFIVSYTAVGNFYSVGGVKVHNGNLIGFITAPSGQGDARTIVTPLTGGTHHFYFGYDRTDLANTELVLYLDGVRITSTVNELTTSIIETYGGNVVFGIYSQGFSGHYYNGVLDDMSLFNRELTTSEILKLYPVTATGNYTDAILALTPLAYWKLGELPAGGDNTNPFKYWKLDITNSNDSNSYLNIAEIEFLNSNNEVVNALDGSGIIATASSEFSTAYLAGMAFNGAIAPINVDMWHTPAGGFPHWIQYDAGSTPAIAVDKVKIYPRSNYQDRSPKDFTLSCSNDGVSWDTVLTVTGQTDWTSEQTFTLDYSGMSGVDTTVAVDEIGVHDGTYVNSPTLGVPSLIYNDADTAVDLDGTNDYLTFPNDAAFAFGTGDFTYSMIVSTTTLLVDKFLIGSRGAIGTQHITSGGSGGAAENGFLRYVGSSTILSDAVVLDGSGETKVIVITRTTGTINLYVNGVLVGTGTDSTNYTKTTGTFTVGKNDSGNVGYFDGTISKVAVFNKALTLEEIVSLYATTIDPDIVVVQTYSDYLLSLGPLVYYTLDDTTGTVAIAAVGDDGTYVGNPTLQHDGLKVNDSGNAVGFVDGKYLTSDMVLVDPASEWTLSFILNMETFVDTYMMFTLKSTTVALGIIISNPDNPLGSGYGLIDINASSGWPGKKTNAVGFEAGVTHTFTLTYNGSYSLYFDGVLQTLDPASGGRGVVPNETKLPLPGTDSGKVNTFVLDDFAVFSKVLTVEEIVELHNKTK